MYVSFWYDARKIVKENDGNHIEIDRYHMFGAYYERWARVTGINCYYLINIRLKYLIFSIESNTFSHFYLFSQEFLSSWH